MGDPSWTTATTLAPPPQPPNLFCSEAGPNYLKLKWKPPGNSSALTTMQYYYYLAKENDNGKFSPVCKLQLLSKQIHNIVIRNLNFNFCLI